MTTTATTTLTGSAAIGPAPLDLPLKVALTRLFNGISPASLVQAYADWLLHIAASPAKQVELGSSAMRKAAQWLAYVATQSRGLECIPCVEPREADKRFKDAQWHALPFSAIAQGFLLQERWWDEATHGVHGVSRHHEEVASFVARQWLDMWSPSNFVATNPEVLSHTARSGGLNLASGFTNWLHDFTALATGGRPRGVEAFEPGRDVAITPGKVVWRNHLVELLQYDPVTPRVDREPVFVVPSWIMKFYILDLTPHDSLARYFVAQGHTVFMLSWRNPGSEDAGLGLQDYVQAVLDAIAAVRRLCPRAHVHAMGYCLGGTLLAIVAAVLAGRHDESLKTVTLVAAQVDFHEPGELGLFMDESQVAFLEDVMAERGYLDGVQMAGAFQLINSKDLVWSKLVHEYLRGATTPMTALRAWNADATRMPARMHAEYLRQLYLRNELSEGRYRFDGEAVDLETIAAPMFVVATERDHVSPWRSVYKVHHLVDAPIEFVLTSGGHNVGIVNPPGGPAASPEASYRMARTRRHAAPVDPQKWLDASVRHAGSWWPEWHRWLRRHSSDARVPARAVTPLLPPAERAAAPGSYVFQR
ncbi:PHA/PHB synthase family protein [Ramlibacter albus]|uniref:Polyhydroxyalkanoic acid synthase n=1 Tax=Ramlibacter albus TaxID=2079448 RepID=A0A923M739_9BURK|nr:alpha/beta fold hydrolase [Ramlibacter albus]MBC5763934.1 polyhydroxyalkanoic acid synthase [Ramlibacter albus]